MKREKGVCKGCGKERFIVNKTHYLCAACNRKRLEKQSKTHAKPKRLYNKSPKRLKEEEWYRQAKAQKKKDMIAGGYYRCFFSNKPLDPDKDYDWHHALGRKGALLYEYKNIFPVISKYHHEYHNLDAARLMKTTWYRGFLKRVKMINHKVYNKELDRLKKGGVISMETFLDEYI